MKFGFEREYFVQARGQFVLCPVLMPHDEFRLWAEARGEPNTNPLQAAYSLLAAEFELTDQAKRNRVRLVKTAFESIDPALVRKARREGKKGPHKEQNMYGLDYRADDSMQHAGLHVHFSDEIECQSYDNKGRPLTYKTKYNGFIDVPKFIFALDEMFKTAIKDGQRVPGMYELKPYGFEYRSLPATVDPRVVAKAITKIQDNTWKELGL